MNYVHYVTVIRLLCDIKHDILHQMTYDDHSMLPDVSYCVPLTRPMPWFGLSVPHPSTIFISPISFMTMHGSLSNCSSHYTYYPVIAGKSKTTSTQAVWVVTIWICQLGFVDHLFIMVGNYLYTHVTKLHHFLTKLNHPKQEHCSSQCVSFHIRHFKPKLFAWPT